MIVNIAVIGAGVVGLSTSINIQERIPGSKVKVIADKFDTETTSYGSCGLFVPTLPAHPNESEENMRRWCKNSWKFYSRLATGPEAGKCGAIVCTGYIVSEKEYKGPLYEPIVFNYKEMSDEELKSFNFPPSCRYGYSATTIIINQHKYLKWLMDRFSEKDGVFQRRRINKIEELAGQYDVVVNCTGVGSREFCDDKKAYPVRGQVVRVKAPWVKHWVYQIEDMTHIIPGEDYITLGSVKQVGNSNLEPTEVDTKHIMEKCIKVIPSLKEAEVDHVWVGLRPGREKIRLETEEIRCKNATLKVVHNYGHFSNGVALAWGTSMDAADLVKKVLSNTQSRL